jgi:hypothetical protein
LDVADDLQAVAAAAAVEATYWVSDASSCWSKYLLGVVFVIARSSR